MQRRARGASWAMVVIMMLPLELDGVRSRLGFENDLYSMDPSGKPGASYAT